MSSESASEDDSNPPWYTFFPHGGMDPAGVPDRLLRHPELQQRGIVPYGAMKPGVVFCTRDLSDNTPRDPIQVIKILDTNGEELPIYELLLREIDRPNNHTVPSEITNAGHPLLIMPFVGYLRHMHGLNWSPRKLVEFLFQFVEGLEYLHSLHVVHMDICPQNVLAGLPRNVEVHKSIVAHRVYIIDFDISRRFKLGPGVQPAITLPDTQISPPNGLRHFDPYSWDVYCMALTMESVIQSYDDQTVYRDEKVQPYWPANKFVQWLVGNERGCTGVCRCRPTARTALRVLVILRWAVYATECYDWLVRSLSRLRAKLGVGTARRTPDDPQTDL
ncbi:uncharacterized protein TRAVEDRAFT_23945 [Trametes versicolor FP-101664 SS1]|uniref:uncharacterized protein n=1 Tax=Trametes versicolor (strain FP-101664) TaxID=717944 RepID=UPI0004623765|nr:uncharacterized protein TRAVEDRAFT_23945 [Trametes versicolor FP-101664 SS1]EIW53695.1 hypothetical protein TRAVEDRAFT_23945 [Trametes versicolor FP-101664 SS1]